MQYIEAIEITAVAKSSTWQSGTLLQLFTDKDIQRTGMQSVADAVRRFAGVKVLDTGGLGGIKTISVRGFGSQHTGVSYDGIMVVDAQTGQIDIGRFSIENLAMLSLVIGQPDDIFKPATYFASAGVLDIKTTSPNFGKKKYTGQFRVKTGSFGYLNPSLFFAHKLNSEWSVSVNGEWQRSDGKYPYTFNNGSIEEKRKRNNNDTDIYRAELNIYGNMKKAGSLKIKLNYFDSEKGLPKRAISGNDISRERLWNKDFLSQAVYENKLNDKISLQGLAKFSRNYNKYTDKDIKYESTGKYPLHKFTQFEYYISGGVKYQPVDALTFSLSQDYTRSALNLHFSGEEEEEGNTYFNRNKAYRNTSLTALSAQFKNDIITATATILGGYYGEDVQKGEKPDNKKKLSPALSVSYKPFDFDLRFRASYKDIYRVPTINDMYYAQTGNLGLKPESTKQYNIGVSWIAELNSVFRFLNLSVDGYYNKVKDKIVITSPSMFVFSMINVDNTTTIKGIDVSALSEISVSEGFDLHISGNYSYQDAKEDETKQQIPYIPKHSGSVNISLENPWLNISYGFVASSEYYTFLYQQRSTRVDSYSDHNISVNKSFAFGDTGLRIQADLLNLSGKTYEVLKGYPMVGRSFRISMQLSF